MRALVRGVPATFADALAAAAPSEPIDVAIARAEHDAYCAALAASGAAVSVVHADDRHPDCCFIEDTAVIAGGVALVARPGAPSRRGETAAVAAALARHLEVAAMTEPATLDGGDVMRVGATIYVGRSARTNAAGIARLAEVFEPRGFRVVALDVPAHILHLKCVCSPLGDDRVLLARESIDPASFGRAAIVWVPADESYAANAVAVGSHALIAAGYPRALDAVAAAGFEPHAVPTSQVKKADGALTCQSLVW